jgi:hypothetical protein
MLRSPSVPSPATSCMSNTIVGGAATRRVSVAVPLWVCAVTDAVPVSVSSALSGGRSWTEAPEATLQLTLRSGTTTPFSDTESATIAPRSRRPWAVTCMAPPAAGLTGPRPSQAARVTTAMAQARTSIRAIA